MQQSRYARNEMSGEALRDCKRMQPEQFVRTRTHTQHAAMYDSANGAAHEQTERRGSCFALGHCTHLLCLYYESNLDTSNEGQRVSKG